MQQSKRINEYTVLRVFAILLVLVSHISYYKVGNEFGGVNILALAPSGTSFKWYYLIDKFRYVIYLFHMPLFMAISGALFALQTKKGRWSGFGSFAEAKWQRLMIPYLVFTLLYLVPLKYLSGYFGQANFLMAEGSQLTLLGNSHLWYLYTLFLVALIAYFLVPRMQIWYLLPLWGIHLVSAYVGLSLISLPMEFLLWYMLGAMFESYRETLTSYFQTKRAVFLTIWLTAFIVCSLLSLYVGRFGIPALQRLVNDLAAVAGMGLTYLLAELLAQQKGFMESSFVKAVLLNGLGIYIFSDPSNYVLLRLGQALLGPAGMLSLGGLVLMMVLRLVLTGLIAYYLTRLFVRLWPNRASWVR